MLYTFVKAAVKLTGSLYGKALLCLDASNPYQVWVRYAPKHQICKDIKYLFTISHVT